MTAITGSGIAASGEVKLDGWKLFAPIPDRVGFGGMFAGVLGGRLVAGGGSQFPEKPLWLKGEKKFSDRIFTLASPDAKWSESATHLPVPVGGAVSVASADAIYIVGGGNATECFRSGWEMRAQGEGFAFTALPELPVASCYGAAAIMAGRLYVVGGVDTPTSKTPNVTAWSLALSPAERKSGWRREPDLPGPGVFATAAASEGNNLYLLGGIGFDAAGKPIPAKAVYRLVAGGKNWEKLADLPEPRVGISSPCPLLGGKGFFLVGGYAEVFPGAPREHPGFSVQTYYFDPATQRYANGPVLPHAPVPDRDSPSDIGPAPMIGAPCVVWRDHVVFVGGEVRSSVRTPTVIAWPLR
ncbi:MAG: hypothetical protein HZA31_04975 [Opitutae bacterium]|nr:hypothetical protein [Opitutae bacterium]